MGAITEIELGAKILPMSDKLIVSEVHLVLVNSFSVLPSYCQEYIQEILKTELKQSRGCHFNRGISQSYLSAIHILYFHPQLQWIHYDVESQRIQFGRGHYAEW